MNEHTDKNLLHCTIKKSADVTAKIVLFVSKIVVGLTAAALASFGICGVWSVIVAPITTIVTWIISTLFTIPWYYYAGILALLAIPMYSLIWCITRELTDSDWSSKEAKYIALAIALALLLVGTVALAIALAIAGTVVLAIAVAIASECDCKALLFVGAYLHYRKRVKACRN